MPEKLSKETKAEWIAYLKGILSEMDFKIWIVKISLGDAAKGYAWRVYGFRNGELESITYKLGKCLEMPWDKRLQAIKTAPFASNGETEIGYDIKRVLEIDVTVKEII